MVNSIARKIGLLFIAIWMTAALSAQSVRLSLPQVSVSDGETVTLPLTVTDFDSIVSLQLSINWDTEVATYVDFTLDALPLLAVGDFQAEQGELRISWFDNTGDGRSLEDGATIVNLTFTAMGQAGDFTDLVFTDEPLEIQIFKATETPGAFEPVNLEQDPGRIMIAAPLGFAISSTDVSCFGAGDGSAQVSLDVDPAEYNLNWTGPDGFTATGLTLDNLAGGVYQLTITDLDGVEVLTYELTITAPAAPLALANLEITDADCDAPTGGLSAQAVGGTGPYAYLLNGDSNLTGNFPDLPAGTYTLLVTDANDCEFSLDTMIIAPGAPVLSLPPSVPLCEETTVLAPGGMGTYAWSTGETTNSISVSETGLFSVTVTSAEGCSATAATEVIAGVLPEGTLENDFTEICPGDSLQLLVSGGDTYRWLSDTATLSALNAADPFAFPDTLTAYQVEVGNECGADTLAFAIEVYDILASAGQDTCVGPGEPAQLMAIGGIFYEWQDNIYPVSDPSIPDPIVMPEDSTTYAVMITDINGCVTLDSVIVLVADDPAAFITPYNLITPNGDGLNDELDFGPISKFGTNTFKVYNRWGDLVYQKVNYQSDEERFDGMHQGARLPAGSYFYVLAFRQGEIQQTLTLVWE